MCISIHAPIVGCDKNRSYRNVQGNIISIHAPIVGCDPRIHSLPSFEYLFQSTHPSWGATRRQKGRYLTMNISIHAPIVGCDSQLCVHKGSHGYFNPRTHRGVRPLSSNNPLSTNLYFNPRTHRGVRLKLNFDLFNFFKYFNPRTHRGVRRSRVCIGTPLSIISIHAPIVGCDCKNSKIST